MTMKKELLAKAYADRAKAETMPDEQQKEG